MVYSFPSGKNRTDTAFRQVVYSFELWRKYKTTGGSHESFVRWDLLIETQCNGMIIKLRNTKINDGFFVEMNDLKDILPYYPFSEKDDLKEMIEIFEDIRFSLLSNPHDSIIINRSKERTITLILEQIKINNLRQI